MRCHHHSMLRGLVLAALLVLPSSAIAQQGDQSRLDQLEQPDVQTELNLSAEQLQKLAGLRESLNDRSGFAELMRKSREVASEEERAQLREEMRNYASTRRQQAEEKLSEILAAEQLARLDQVSLLRRGLRALADDDVAASLNLTDDQKLQIAKLSEERDAARRDTEGDVQTDERREQFRAEWDARYALVLTAEQRRQWAAMTGPPMGGGGISAGAQAVASQPVSPAATPPAGGNVVASFGAPRTDTAKPHEEGKLYFTFQNALWSEVLPLFAEAAHLTLDLVDTPKGTFTHTDDDGYTVTEALDVLNGYLLQRGYILVRRDKFLVCINVDDPIPPNLVPTVSVEELPDRGRNELMTVVFSLQGVDDVDAVATEVEKLKGPQGTVVGITPTRSLVVTDIGSNLERINILLHGMSGGGVQDLIFKEYALQHILADDAEFIVRTLLGLSIDGVAASSSSSASSSNQSNQSDRDRDRNSRFGRFGAGSGFPFGGPFGNNNNNPAPTTSGSSNRSSSKANTIADPRTNKLLVSATLAEHRIVEEALKTIDVAERSPMASDRPYGSLGDKQMTVISLSNYDPTAAAVMLQSLFSKEGDEAPVISADLVRRQLIVRATEAQMYQIKQLLLQLGEDGTGTRTAANRGPVRTYNLSGRDPSELLPILERMWAAQRGSNLRVIVPGAEDEATRRRADILRGLDGGDTDRGLPEPPARERPQRPDGVDRSSESDDDGRVQRIRHPFDDDFAVGAEAGEGPRQQTSEVQAPSASDDGAGITIRVVGDQLFIVSQDEIALDELELMLENVMQAVPPRTTWSIYPLKSADATEAAAMLEQLFPDSKVSSASTSSSGTLGAITSGIANFGSGVADLTGLSDLGTGPQTLRIIPETRLNALWVAGPAYKVQEVEDMLKILDSSGLIDSLRDRVPRLIPVKYADIDDVFEIVSSVYAPELQAPGAAGGDPRQAFAAMFGGGRRGGDDENRNAQQQAEPKVTLGVDRDTSHLIVSADEGTFLEIEQLVLSVDQAAESARRTVAVRPLINTNASVLQESLTSIIPKVTVSTSASRSRPSTSSSNNSSSSQPGNNDDLQQRMEAFRRLREQGGGFPGGFGGGGPGGFSRGGFGGGDRGSRGGSDRGGGDRGGGDRGGQGR